MYLNNPVSHEQGMTQGQYFKRNTAGMNSKFVLLDR